MGEYVVQKQIGACFEISIDGKARSYRDRKEIAIEAGEYLKQMHPSHLGTKCSAPGMYQVRAMAPTITLPLAIGRGSHPPSEAMPMRGRVRIDHYTNL
jgi:hypothetical protein